MPQDTAAEPVEPGEPAPLPRRRPGSTPGLQVSQLAKPADQAILRKVLDGLHRLPP